LENELPAQQEADASIVEYHEKRPARVEPDRQTTHITVKIGFRDIIAILGIGCHITGKLDRPYDRRQVKNRMSAGNINYRTFFGN